MTISIDAPADMADDLGGFLSAESIDLSVVTDESGILKISQTGPERQESDLDTIYAGGWITCTRARSLAKRLSIASRDVGRLLDHLDVKVRECELGCF